MASIETQSVAQGRQRVVDYVDQLGGRVIRDLTIDATRDAVGARVVVQAQSSSLVPGMRLPIRASAERPLERFQGRST